MVDCSRFPATRPEVRPRVGAGDALAASIMCADFGDLRHQLSALWRGGVRRLHLDFGDGRFVPNFPLGVEVFGALPARPRWATECHLMIDDPDRVLDLFLPHTDLIIFHLEATRDPASVIGHVRAAGRQVGLAMNPATSIESLLPWLSDIDEVLVMAVEPGFAGRSFVPSVVQKVQRIRREVDLLRHPIPIEIDGAVSAETARVMARAGASRFVGGTSGLFRRGGLEQNARDLLTAIAGLGPDEDKGPPAVLRSRSNLKARDGSRIK